MWTGEYTLLVNDHIALLAEVAALGEEIADVERRFGTDEPSVRSARQRQHALCLNLLRQLHWLLTWTPKPLTVH